MPTKLIISVITLVLTVVFIIAVYFHISLWFLWYLLPEEKIKIAVNSTQPGSQIITDILSAFPIKEDTVKLLNSAKRYSYAQTDKGSVIALVPKNPFLFKDRNLLINELRNNNWHTINFGLVIIGKNNNSTPNLSSLRSVIINTYNKLLSRQHPYKPTIIAQSNNSSIPLLSGDTALVGVVSRKNKEFKAIIAPSLSNMPNFSISGPALPNQANHLTINIPGKSINAVSTKFSNEWNDIIYSKLGFSATSPPIISYMAVQQTSSMTITNEKAALAMIGDTNSLKGVFHQWMQEEEAHSRPQKHAFRLPDGTIGYELIKGETQPVLSAPDSSGCLAPISEAIKLWLCQNDKGISIATSRADAMQELSSISSSVQTITIGNDYLQRLDFLPVKHFQSLSLYSSGEYTMITTSLKQDE